MRQGGASEPLDRVGRLSSRERERARASERASEREREREMERERGSGKRGTHTYPWYQ